MKPLTLKTSKLFFGKHPYKIKCVCKGAWMIKRLGIRETILRCLNHNNKPERSIFSIHKADPNTLLLFLNDVEIFLDQNITVRTETDVFNIYCSDEKLFNRMVSKLKLWITEIHIPANNVEQQFMLENNKKKVLCNHLPFKTYKFKVYLKISLTPEIREKFYTWSLNYFGKIKIPNRVNDWMKGKKQWVVNPSFYVSDSSTLSMVWLFLGDKVSKIEEFVPRAMINTNIEDQLCLV